ncbi:hypothetical protein IWZ03DRAFT_442729 [Phyllosticta citriasiana]|uniref:Sodium/calcium exchanger membrane region domain-containing protein n=1 Tax=Phyllosticta citriasiana TaxID=595635 RepID=A0ABR1KG92_9PEZI
MPSIDTIKSKARHTAWKVGKSNTNWNPWARKISHTGDSLYDEENPRPSTGGSAASRAHSEGCIQNASEHSQCLTSPRTVRPALGPPSTVQGIGDQAELRRLGETERRNVMTRARRGRSRTSPWTQFKHVVFGSWVNILLLAVPAGFAVNYAHLNGIIVFVINFIAIIPLAVVGIQALVKDEIVITKTSLIGSMLSNLLLVMGMCFFFGGVNRLEQFFNVTVAQTAASLLALAVASLIIPTVFRLYVEPSDEVGDLVDTDALSRGTSVILLFVYGCYLLFQLKTHAAMYNEPGKKVEKINQVGAGAASAVAARSTKTTLFKTTTRKRKEVPVLTVWGSLIALAGSTCPGRILLRVHGRQHPICRGHWQRHVGNFSRSYPSSPIVGNAAEHATAVTVAMKDKMDLAIGVAVGSSMQIALLVFPVKRTYRLDSSGKDDMNLDFEAFQIVVLFVSVLLVQLPDWRRQVRTG